MTDELPSILLVEDDEIDRMVVKRAFAKNDISNPLLIARDGEEAYEHLKGINGNDNMKTCLKSCCLISICLA